jgi:hypothetical protein
MERNVGAIGAHQRSGRPAQVSRKFVHAQKHKARCALDDAFIFAATDDTVLFQIQVTKRWLRSLTRFAPWHCPSVASARSLDLQASNQRKEVRFFEIWPNWPISVNCGASR